MGSTATNPIALISNNCGFDVDIYDVFNPSTDPNTLGPLTYTKLATVNNAATNQQVQTIHFASQLQAMFSGNVKGLNGNYYQQIPVAVLAVSPFKDSNAFTISKDMQQSMIDSFKFIKYSQANPSSKLAKQFRTALGDKTSQKDAVNKFFQNTASFKLCTISTWTAVLTWQAQFTTPWQGTYYLYSLGQTSVSSSSGSSAPALVATLAIAAGTTDCSAVLTMAGTDDENTSVIMAGDGTMQEEDQGTGNLSVALTPTWLNVAQTSKKDGKTVSNYVIGAAFAGTINGVKVAGNLNQLAIPPNGDTSKSACSKDSANSFTLNSFTSVVGMLTSIGMLYYMAKGHKQAETKAKNEAQEQAADRADADAREAAVEANYQVNDVAQVNAQAARVEVADVPRVQQGYEAMDQAADIQGRQSAIQQQEAELEDLLSEGPASQSINDAALDLSKASDELDAAMDPATDPVARGTALDNATNILKSTSKDIETTLKQQSNTLSEEEKTALENTRDALNDARDQSDAQKANQDEQEKKDDRDVDDPVEEGQFEDPEPEVPDPFPVGE